MAAERVQYVGWFVSQEDNCYGYIFCDEYGNEADHYRSRILRDTTFAHGGWYFEDEIEESLRTGYAVRVPAPGQ